MSEIYADFHRSLSQVPWNVTSFQGNSSDFTFQAAIDTNVTNHAFRWGLADQPLFLDYGNPALLDTKNDAYINNGSNAMIKYDFDTGYVFLIIDGKNLPNTTVKTPSLLLILYIFMVMMH